MMLHYLLNSPTAFVVFLVVTALTPGWLFLIGFAIVHRRRSR